MTTHQTPPHAAAPDAKTWQKVVQANNDSAATDGVDWVEVVAPHYAPRRHHRWLWHCAIPIGELLPGRQEITARSGTAVTAAGAKRKITRVVNRHFAEAGGRDPHGPALDRVRAFCLALLVVTGGALLAVTAGCEPSMLGGLVLAAGVVGIAATMLKAHRANRRM